MGRCEIDRQIQEPKKWKRLVSQLKEYVPPRPVPVVHRPRMRPRDYTGSGPLTRERPRAAAQPYVAVEAIVVMDD